MWGGGKLKGAVYSDTNKKVVNFRRKNIKNSFFLFRKLGRKKYKYRPFSSRSLKEKRQLLCNFLSHLLRYLLCYLERHELRHLLRQCSCLLGCLIGHQFLRYFFGFLRHLLHLLFQLLPLLLLCYGLYRPHLSPFSQYLLIRNFFRHLLRHFLFHFCSYYFRNDKQYSFPRLLHHSLCLISYHLYLILCSLSYLRVLLRLFSWYYCWFYLRQWLYLSYWYSMFIVFRRHLCHILCHQLHYTSVAENLHRHLLKLLHYTNVAENHHRHLLKLVRYRYRHLMYCRNLQRQSVRLSYYILHHLFQCRYHYLLCRHLYQLKRYILCLSRYSLWYLLRYFLWSLGCDELIQSQYLPCTWCELDCCLSCDIWKNYWRYQLVKFFLLFLYRQVYSLLWCCYYLTWNTNCRPLCQPVSYRLRYFYNIWLKVRTVLHSYWNLLKYICVVLLSWSQVCFKLCCVCYVLYKWYSSLFWNIVWVLAYQLYRTCLLLGLLHYHYGQHQRILGFFCCNSLQQISSCAYYYCRYYSPFSVTTQIVFRFLCTQTERRYLQGYKYQGLLLHFLCHHLPNLLRHRLCNSAVCSLCTCTWSICSVSSHYPSFSLCSFSEQSSCCYLHRRSCGKWWRLNQLNKRNGDGAWINVWIVEFIGFFQNGKGERVDCNRKLKDHVRKYCIVRKNRKEEVVKEDYLLEGKKREFTVRSGVARTDWVIEKEKREKLYCKLVRKNEQKRKLKIRYIRGSTLGLISRHRKHGDNKLRCLDELNWVEGLRQDRNEREESSRGVRQRTSKLFRRDRLIYKLVNKKGKCSGYNMYQMWNSVAEKRNSVKEGGQIDKSEKVKSNFGIKVYKKSRKCKLHKETKLQRIISIIRNKVFISEENVRDQQFKEEGKSGVTLYGIREQTHTEYRNRNGRNMRKDGREIKGVKIYEKVKRNISQENEVEKEMRYKEKQDKREYKLIIYIIEWMGNSKTRSKEKGMYNPNARAIQKVYLEKRKLKPLCVTKRSRNGYTRGHMVQMSGDYCKYKADDIYISIIRKIMITSEENVRGQQYKEDGKCEVTLDGIWKQIHTVHRNRIWRNMRKDERDIKGVKLYRKDKRNISEENEVVKEMRNKEKHVKRDYKLRIYIRELNRNPKTRSKQKGMHSLNARAIQKAYLGKRDKAKERNFRRLCVILLYFNGYICEYMVQMSRGYWPYKVDVRIDEDNRCRERMLELKVICQTAQGNYKGMRICCEFMNINLRKREGKINTIQGEKRKERVQTRRKGGFKFRLIQGLKMKATILYRIKKVGCNWKRRMGIRKYD